MLATMKAGATAIALDVTMPEDRLKAMIRQVDPSIVLSSNQNRGLAQRLVLDRTKVIVAEGQIEASVTTRRMLPKVDPSSPIYIVFTSGSTGTPKGIIMSHRNISSAILHQKSTSYVDKASRVFDFASYAFDIAWSNFLKTAAYGGCLCIPSETDRTGNIAASMNAMRVNFAQVTPGVARVMKSSPIPSLAVLSQVGEPLSLEDISNWDPKITLHTGYGPAECALCTTLLKVDPETHVRNIGRGQGVITWIVCSDGQQLAPIGAVGELWLEGPLVGQGYLNNPEKTTEAFVEDPQWLLAGRRSDQPGRRLIQAGRHGRLYRTGDLVRYDGYGSLIFIGRRDSQVKIRGQRLELGEVEYHVQHGLAEGEIRASVVAELIVKQEISSSMLVAFLCIGNGAGASEGEHQAMINTRIATLEEKLAEVLPRYMIPSAYVAIKKIPMTPTGKIDRRRLREIGQTFLREQQIANEQCKRLPPANSLQKNIQEVWAEVLNINFESISMDSVFTGLGGDSIAAMRVVSRCRARNIAVTVGDILRQQTIKKLSVHCVPVRETPVMAEQEIEGRTWVLSPVQQAYFDAHPQGLNHFNQSFWLKLRIAVSPTAVVAVLHSLITRHPMLRARFGQSNEGTWEQYITPISPEAVCFVEHHLERRSDVQSIAQSRQESLNIEEGPVFAVDLFSIKAEAQALLLSAHHLVVDSVSWRIIWHDIEQCLTGGVPLLRETVSFQQWCKLQQEKSQNLRPEQVLPVTVGTPPIDYWGPSTQGNVYGDCRLYTASTDKGTTSLLLGRSNTSFRTEPVDILLATLIHSFHQIFHDRCSPVVFVEADGREPIDGAELDLSDTVGWFTTLHPFQVHGNASKTLFETIKSIKDLRRQVPGKGQPYFAGRYYSLACRTKFEGHGMVELLFSFAGLHQHLESKESLLEREDRPEIARELVEVSQKAQRLALIVASARIENGETILSLEVNSHMAHQKRLQRWVTLWKANLQATTISLADRPATFMLSDFPLLSLSEAGLESFVGSQLAGSGVKVDDVQDIYPCTPLQEGIVLSAQKGSAAYANHLVWQCLPTGSGSKTSPRQLEIAWRCTARRHSILSAIFVKHPESGGFVHVQLKDPTPRVVHIDSGLISAADALKKVNKPFFSAGEPEHAVTICQNSRSGEVACRLDISHALYDAASVQILARDFARAYNGKTLPAAPYFREVVQHLERTPRSVRLEYWRTYLAKARSCKLPSFQLERDHMIQGNSCSQIMIPVNATMAIDSFCRRRHITRSVLLQVAWALVLSHHTGMDEVCYGYLASGRDAPIDQIEELVGPLINMLVSRVDLSQPLEKVVANAKEHSIEHLAHQHISLAEIHHGLGLGSQYLFNTIMTLREAHDYEDDTSEEIHLRDVSGKDEEEFDMLLDVCLAGSDTKVSLAYRNDFMSDSSANEIGWTLETAINYLLNAIDDITPVKNGDHRPDGDSNRRQDLTRPSSKSLANMLGSCPVHESFFKYMVGADEGLAVAFWQNQFKALDAQHFPPLPSPSYQTNPNQEFHWSIDNFQCYGGDYSGSTIICAAWAILLATYTDADEAMFGTTLNRRHAALANGKSTVSPKPVATTEQISRPISLTMPVRVIVYRNKTVGQLLRQVQDQADKMATFERMGLSQIRRVSPEAERATQFQTILVEGRVEGKSELRTSNAWKNVSLGCSYAHAIVVRYDFEEQGLRLAISFDSGVIESKQVRMIAQQLEHVLRQIHEPENAARKLAEVEMMSEQDIRDVWSWNAIVPETKQACVHDQIAKMVRKQSNASAIHAWDGELTYGELDEKSTRLAFLLLERLGMGPETIVPLCFEKSMWMPVAILGVMKGGGASVAMDVTQPQERLRSIVRQVKPKFILASAKEQDLAHRLTDCALVVVVERYLEQHLEAFACSHGRISLPSVDPSCSLYIVFTSGSTGTPKGVVISHRNFSSAIVEQQMTSCITKTSRVYDFSSYAFDMIWVNFLKTMAYGGCLCIPSEADRKDIVASMNTLKVNFAHLTPGVARIIKSSVTPIPSLSTVSQGGEPLLQDDFSNWGSHITLHTGYGPAECTPSATLLQIDDPRTHNSRNIGRGQGLVTWVVRNDGQQLVPIGAPGELWLEGPLVGEGYLNDPQKTAAAFFDDPPWLLRGSSVHKGRRGRFYRTGDLVQYHTDGSLIFRGRKDNQVKIRGQRVELAEVETHVQSALGRYGISAKVLAELIRPVGKTDPILAAFVSTSQAGVEALTKEQAANEDELAIKISTVLSKAIKAIDQRLAELIPAYMIPTVYVPLGKLPMMASGKMDRRKVREIGEAMTLEQLAALIPSPGESGERRHPQTRMERELQGLWASVLSIEASFISATDSFLRVGGDSIQAMKLVAMAHERGISLTVADVFKYPQLCDLASRAKLSCNSEKLVVEPFSLLKRDRNIASIPERVAISCGVDQQKIEDVFPCTPLQEGLIAMTVRRSNDYVNRLAFEVNESVDVGRLSRAWQDMAATLPILRTRIVDLAEPEGLVQVVIQEPLRCVEGSKNLQQYLEHDKQSQIGLSEPLNWIGVVKDSVNRRSFVVWTIHHALYDGWSLPFMLKEVECFYYGMPQEQRQQVPYQNFVQHMLEMNKEQAESYWQDQLAGAREAVTFPELPRISYQPQADQIVDHQITDLRWHPGDYTTSTMIRTAWALLQARFTNSNEALFGVTVMGRQTHVSGIHRIIGPTLATVPVRVVLKDASVEELFHQIQSQALEMTAFEQTGLQRIRRISSQVAHGSHFQTLLVIQAREQGDNISDNVERGAKLFEPVQVAAADIWNDVAAFNTYAMMLICQPRTSGLDLQISFDSAILSAARAQRLVRQLEFILRQLCAETNQQTRIKDIQMVSEQDIRDIWRWNVTVPAAVEACVHDIITKRVQEHPRAPAVHSWDGALTYEELDSCSTQLAQRLMQFGAKPEEIIPLCFEKSMWTPVAMLGVMKVGGTFVLLDSSLPEARLQDIVNQVGARLIISSAQEEALSSRLAVNVILVSGATFRARLENSVTRSLPLPVGSPNAPLYVVFTSGSTGRPKGVVITHVNYLSGAHYRAFLFGYNKKSRLLDFVSYNFDVSIDGILAMLCQGGCICVLSDTDRLNGHLAEPINQMNVNTMSLTPTVARLLEPKTVPTLTSLQVGGEPMAEKDIRMWADQLKLIHSYGPSECSVTSVANVNISTSMKASITDARNLGRGVGSVTWVVDPVNHQHLVPIGAVGELLLEGPIVGRGYLDDAEKTAAAFIQDPSWLLAGGRRGRLYKTGDLVRYDSDGTLIFCGRKDTQVKIHGQRVELAEVEHHVQQCLPESTGVVAEVIVPGGGAGEPTLVVFVQAYSETIGGREEAGVKMQRQATQTWLTKRTAGLGEILAEVLPRYMVPSAYISVAAIPLTPSARERGGDDCRGAGEANGGERHQASPGYRVGTSTAAAMVDGGDSIRAMKLVAAARSEGLLITVEDIFKRPKLCDLARNIEEVALDAAVEIAPFTLLASEVAVEEVRADIAWQCGVEVEQVVDAYPCTALQEGLMALSIKSGAYVAQHTMKLSDTIELDRLQKAWDAVVASSAILRTRIVQVEGCGLVQAVLTQSVGWTMADSLKAHLAEDRARPMGLAMALTRLAIVNDTSGQRFMVWTAHHATYDGWSMRLILRRLAKVYLGERIGQAPPYQTFIKYLGDLDQEAVDNFWRTELKGVESPQFPILPSYRYCPRANSVVQHNIELAPQAGSSTVTIAILIRTAWSVVMKRLSGSNDIVFGVTVTGRNAPVAGIEDIEGPTFTTLPVRIRLNEDMIVKDLLEAVQTQAAASIAFEQRGLQNIRRLGADAVTACDFQSLLIIQPDEKEDHHFLDLQDEPGSEWSYLNTYAITLNCFFSSRGVRIEAYFDEHLFQQTQMRMILNQLECAIRGLTSDDKVRLKEIDTLDTVTKTQIWQWNKTLPTMTRVCVHDLVGLQCQKQPNAPAVKAWDGELTYAELDRLSLRLAQRLIEDVSPEELVPLRFEKSMWAIVAMLGVIRAGAAFVLLDDSQPEVRLQSIIDQVNKARMVLSSTKNAVTSSKLATKQILVSHAALEELPRAVTTRKLSATSPEATLYVVFTSGSTGVPKGVVITHTAFASAAYHRASLIGFDHTTRLLDFGSYSFDLTISNILDGMMNGSCLYVPSKMDSLDDLGGYINKMQLTHAALTPTVARQLMPSAVSSLACLLLGGEPLAEIDVMMWVNCLDLINGYGPAECSCSSTFHLVKSTTANPRSIGWGAGSVTWVVDLADHERLVPIGTIGELLIEGPAVGRGYLNDPYKTKAAFIEDPMFLLAGGGSGQPGRRGRLYKTGDLVRYHVDGSLIYVGRVDTQVKIHGQRIELGEVEQSVGQRLAVGCKIVAEVIVPAGSSEPTLVAFVQMTSEPERDSDASGEELSDFNDERRQESYQSYLTAQMAGLNKSLSDVLPRYMIPSAYIAMTAMPLTASGKTDRKQLRKFGAGMTTEDLTALRGVEAIKRGPSSANESVLRRLWSKVLGMAEDSIGVDDSFFRLGGDSIRAMKLVAAARTEGLQLSVADIFYRPKLCNMATYRHLDTAAQGQLSFQPFWSLNVANVEELLVDGIHPQIKLQHYRIEDVLATTDFQDYAIRATHEKPRSKLLYILTTSPAFSDIQRLIAACRSLSHRHDALRAVFVSHNHSFLQVILENIEVEITVSKAEADPITFAKRVCAEDVEGELPLGSPCLRFWIIQQEDQGICLILRISHAQYDGIGMPVMLRDLHALYEKAPMPPAQPFSTYINNRIQAADAQCKDYWRNLLEGSSMTPLPSEQREDAALMLEGDRGPAVSLKAAVPMPKVRHGVTLATLISVALALVISRTTSRSDIVFGQLTSGRNLPVPSIDKIVGACINVVPIRLQFPPGKTVSELLSVLQDQKIASAPFEFYGLTEIVENCVNWPMKTKFNWAVQHQNIEEVQSLLLGGGDSKVEYFAPHLGKTMEDVVWLCTESGQNELQIVLIGREFRAGFLEQVLEDLKTILAQGPY